MLAQHLITRPVFDALFSGSDFTSHNPVSKRMQGMIDTLDGSGLEAETSQLEGFYASVRRRAAEVTTAHGKQQVIAELYEKFFRIGFKKQSDALGIVYTPTEIVDFILHAADTASRQHFGRGLTDEGVHVLDGFAGTGTFTTRLLQSGLIADHDLARKYTHELHANEIMLLAYYIAAVNIETTHHALTGKTAATDTYQPFEGIVLADTFQISEAGDSMDTVMFPYNNARIQQQLDTPINVIVANPPLFGRAIERQRPQRQHRLPHPRRPHRRHLRQTLDGWPETKPVRLLHSRHSLGHRPHRRRRHRRLRHQRRVTRR